MRQRAGVLLGLVLLGACGILAGGMVGAQSGSAERQVVERAAQALGGLERIRQIRNVTLVGYGQYAYQFGGGNISADPNAPMKYQAANDLRRVYDLENGRYQQFERRNFLFPFAAPWGHNFAPVNQVLDGDIAYDVQPDGQARRVPRWMESPQQIDGVHMRRMWMLNNPVVAVRRALDPGTRLSNLRRENGVTRVDLMLAEGDRLTLAFDQRTHLPAWVRWANPQPNVGQMNLTTHFVGYAPFGGVLLPLGYTTKLDWRDVDWFKVYVDNYSINGEIPDLAAPEAVRNAPDVQRAPVPRIEATVVAPGVWRLTGGTIVFEFEDHLTLFELGGDEARTLAILEFLRTLVPGKPATQVIASHNHFDHVSGVRAAIAQGLTVISRRNNEQIFRIMAEHRAPDFPDAQERNRRPLKFMPVDEHLRLSDGKMTVDVYWARNNIHMADAVFAYVPAHKVLVEGDIATAARDFQFWADNYMDNIEHYALEVETLAPVHMEVMKQSEVIEMIRGGVERARAFCAEHLAEGNYFTGCPVQSRRY